MNTARLNFTRLNTSVLNASLLNSSLMGGRGKGSSSRPSGLIAQYKPYLNSNDSPTRDVLKDYSGHGNDVTLHNFAYAGMSGYGGYPVNSISTSSSVGANELISEWSVRVTDTGFTGMRVVSLDPSSGPLTFKVRIEGNDNPDYRLYLYHHYNGEPTEIQQIYGDGVFEFTVNPIANDNNNYTTFYVSCRTEAKGFEGMNLIITLLPNYPGALVSDGVDDYGICENFPILTKEKGYTVCVLRKILSEKNNSVFLSKAKTWSSPSTLGAFNIEYITASGLKTTRSFGSNVLVDYDSNLFLYQTKDNYNGLKITVGSNTDNPILKLFGDNLMTLNGNYALYALEIYDRDLTEEEIEQVKQRMIAEYEKATGNVLEGTILLEDGTDQLLEDGTSLLME